MKRAKPFPKPDKEVLLEAAKLTNPAARLSVANYYMFQEMRKRFDMQIRHLGDKEPPAMLQWSSDGASQIEGETQKSLLRYAENSAVGRWCLKQVGVGPVISAGLLAHIDIEKAPTAGHIWRFAGLDPSIKWRSAEWTKGFIANQRKEHKKDEQWETLIGICTEFRKRPLSVLQSAEIIENIPSPDDIRKYLKEKKADRVLKAEYHADNMLAEATDKEVSKLAGAYRDLFPDVEINWVALTKTLSRRPWNAELKQICWHAGQCFMKVSGNENALYGQIYKEHKQLVETRNEQGVYAERSKIFVTKSADQKKVLEQGRLPQGNLDSQARRKAVKIFLSHFHAVLYWDHYKKPPPKPFTIAILGHAHEVAIPDIDMFPGFREAYYGGPAASAVAA